MTLIAEILASVATIIGGVYGVAKLIAYYVKKSTAQKIVDANVTVDQQLDSFEKTGRPE